MNHSDYMEIMNSTKKAQQELDNIRLHLLASETGIGISDVRKNTVNDHKGGALGPHKQVELQADNVHQIFKNVQAAADYMGISRSRLSHLLNAHVSSVRGYTVRFMSDDVVSLP